MKIAYLILAHKHPNQIARLASRLSKSGDIFIHVDKKVKLYDYECELKNIPNAYLEKNRISVSWAGWSIVKSYLQLLNRAYNSDKSYDRFVFLTGQDYPLMSDFEIVSEFEKNLTTEYVMAYNIVNSTIPTDKNKTTKKWYLDCPFKSKFLRRAYKSITYRVLTKPFSSKETRVKLGGQLVDPYFGQMLSAFTRNGAKLILDTYSNDKNYNKKMKRVHAPDELYWHTIIFNSSLRKNAVQNGEEHVITEHFGWAPLHYHSYDVETSVFTEDDFEELKNTGYMFCRKVVTGVSDKLMDLIDEWRNEKENSNSIE